MPAHKMPAQDNAPFPFLRLPKELRLMVYERLPDTRTITALDSKKWSAGRSAIIYNVSLPIGILATCREIHEEATPIVENMKREIASKKPMFDGQWDLPEFADFMLKLYQHGPVLSASHLKQRVAKFFAPLEPSAQKAIVKFLLRVNIHRQDHATNYNSFCFRIVQIVSKESHYVCETMKDAWHDLRVNMVWNEEREFKLSQGGKDIGLATHSYPNPYRIIVTRDNAMTVFEVQGADWAKGSETLLEMPDGWENAYSTTPQGFRILSHGG